MKFATMNVAKGSDIGRHSRPHSNYALQERVVSGSLVLADNGRRLGLKILDLQQSLR